MSNERNAVSNELAMRDLGDIKNLQRSEEFNRYYLRRLKAKHAEAEKKFKYEEAEKCSPARREEYRQIMLTLEEVLSMMALDESACRSILVSANINLAI